MAEDSTSPLQKSLDSSSEPTPEERAAKWTPEWAGTKSPTINKGAVAFLGAAVLIIIAILVFASINKHGPSSSASEGISDAVNSNRVSTVSPSAPSKELKILQE